MTFVDGENLAIRAKDVFRQAGLAEPANGNHYERDVFVWMPAYSPLTPLPGLEAGVVDLAPRAIRAHYYTTVRGDMDKVTGIRRRLKALGFHPEVFKKEGDGKAKGVDIALSKDLLSHAFNHHYDAAVLIAGDGDYVPLLQETKRCGRRVCVAFFEGFGLHEELALHADSFFELTPLLLKSWGAAFPEGSGSSGAQCDLCGKQVRFDQGDYDQHLTALGWSRRDIMGVVFTVCQVCERRVTGPDKNDLILRAALRSRGVDLGSRSSGSGLP